MATPTTLPSAFATGDVLTAAQMNNLRGAFRVLQVVSTTKTDTFTGASATPVNVTGLTATITPAFTSSKILVIATVNMMYSTGISETYVRLARGTTAIAVADAAGVRPQTSAANSDVWGNAAMIHLDSPNTTSATTYAVQTWSYTGATFYVNRTYGDPNNQQGPRAASSITVLEISA